MHDVVCIYLQPVIAERAEGSYVWTTDGQKHLDMSGGTAALELTCELEGSSSQGLRSASWSPAGIGVTSTGHCHPRVVKAIQDQAAKFIHAQQNVFTASVPQVRPYLWRPQESAIQTTGLSASCS